MIKAICFDLDGVYFLNGKENFIRNLERLGVSEAEARRVFLKSDEMNHQYKEGKMSDKKFWTWAAHEWKLPPNWEQLVTLLIEGYMVNEDAAAYVKEIRKKGYKTLICSNNFPARINGLQKQFGFLDDFDVKVFSYEVGVSKPDKKIFEELIKKSKVSADEIFYADDDETKLHGAKELGINTFVYSDWDGFVQHLEKLGVK